MNENRKKTSIKWLEKLKNVKHIEIYIAVIFIVILLLIFLSSNKTKETKQSTKTNEMSVTAYIEYVERSLEESLSNIAGISNVNVMITLDLKNSEVIDDKISITKFPEIKGVLITAKGVNNTTNKMKVLHAVQAVIDITNGNIEILSSE